MEQHREWSPDWPQPPRGPRGPRQGCHPNRSKIRYSDCEERMTLSPCVSSSFATTRNIARSHGIGLCRLSAKLLHHDPVALDFVQIKLVRCSRLGRRHIGRLASPRISPLARRRTTRQRRFIRLASLAGVSLLVQRRGGMPSK
jgi:hypothetical protein